MERLNTTIFLKILIVISTITIQACSSGGGQSINSSTALEGSWTGQNIVMNGRVCDPTWRFKNDEFASSGSCSDGTSFQFMGTFSLGTEVVMQSGVTANKIDFEFIPSEETLLRSPIDVIYFNQGQLFWGHTLICSSCSEGEDCWQDDVAIVTNTTRNVRLCYERPIDINFDESYYFDTSL